MPGAASETRLLQKKLSSITSHPFVNFFLELCKSRDGFNPDDLAKEAGSLWQKMDVSEKVPYYRLARKVKKIVKSKRGLDLPRNQVRRRRSRAKQIASQEDRQKILLARKRTHDQEKKEGAGSSKVDKNESGNLSTTDCDYVQNHWLDTLKRRYSRSSVYESD